MISVVISIGSNCGDRHELVEQAISWLKSFMMQVRCSDIYETPCALKAGKPYMNAVLQGFFEGSGIQLDDKLKEKEREMGRSAQCREKGDVPIDMDIVVCDGSVYKEWDYRQRFFRIGYEQLSKDSKFKD